MILVDEDKATMIACGLIGRFESMYEAGYPGRVLNRATGEDVRLFVQLLTVTANWSAQFDVPIEVLRIEVRPWNNGDFGDPRYRETSLLFSLGTVDVRIAQQKPPRRRFVDVSIERRHRLRRAGMGDRQRDEARDVFAALGLTRDGAQRPYTIKPILDEVRSRMRRTP